MERKNAWEKYPEGKKRDEVFKFAEEYRQFISNCKTERECTSFLYEKALKEDFVDLNDVIKKGKKLKAGDRVVANNMGKGLAMFIIGKKDLDEGMNILGAHIDSPRMDLKQVPVYQDLLYKTNFTLFDTHYYGGIKKYQWVAIPLALHGVVAKKDGSVVEINIGEEEDDPVFCISDLLIHLSGEQMEKKGAKVVEGEALNLLIGNMPLKDEEKDAVKRNVLNLLKEKYDIEEEDFLSAELEVVPAGKARECGLDRSMILAYGQDDRVCAYTSLEAILDTKKVKRTACCILVDKEEIGSVGATGMQSRFFENTVAELLNCMGVYSDLALRRTLANSKMLSSDVSAAYDPEYASVFEKKNAAYFAKGIVFNKYTGSRGKSGSNDANAEYMAELRKILEKHNVAFQTAELGKVDIGGGGTIAYILALYGMQVIDCGVAVMSMHAPWEIVSKADVYEAKKCYMAFLAE